MTRTQTDTHTQTIIDQFTQQAAAFTALPIHSDGEAMALCLSLAQLSAQDTVLDVACGPGILACAMARVAAQVEGLDVTPAMLEQARQRQQAEQLSNLRWHLGDGLKLPFADGHFSLVTCRYAFHHMPDPAKILAEMRRVCAPKGRLMLIDATPQPAARDEYDALERLRDPSHVKALTHAELCLLAQDQGLTLVQQGAYHLEVDLAQQLAASAMTPEAATAIRHRLTADATEGLDRHGVAARYEGDSIRIKYPVSVLILARQATVR